MGLTQFLKTSLAMMLVLVISNKVAAQDPAFTQFYANPVYLNPAMAGTNGCPRVALNFRQQWPRAVARYTTYSASYDQHVNALNGGIAVQAVADRAGAGLLNTNTIGVAYAYEVEITKKLALKAGLQATYLNRTLDFSTLTFPDQIDPRYGFIYSTQEAQANDALHKADFSAGLLGFTEKLYFGFAAHHLTQPNISFYQIVDPDAKLPMRFTQHFGAVIPFNKKYPEEGSISPNVILMQQGPFRHYNLGLYVTRRPFVAGLWYRHGDALSALVGIQIEGLRIGYSYDITINRLSGTGGSNEISLAFLIPCSPKTKKPRALVCPTF